MWTWVRHHPMVVAFVVIIFVLVLGMRSVSMTIYDSQIAACERGNTLRVENNERAKYHNTDTQALRDALDSLDRSSMSAKAQDQYIKIRASLDSVKFDIIPPVICKKVVEKPTW